MSATTGVAVAALVVSVLTALLAWRQTDRLGKETSSLGGEANELRRRLVELEEARDERERRTAAAAEAKRNTATLSARHSTRTGRLRVVNMGPATARDVTITIEGRVGEALPELVGDVDAEQLPAGSEIAPSVQWRGDRIERKAVVRWVTAGSEGFQQVEARVAPPTAGGVVL